MTARPQSRARGLSLLETVVVAGVISLIIIFTLAVIPSFKFSNRRANMELQAGALAQSRLEELRVAPFGSAAEASFPDETLDGITYRTSVTVSNPVQHGDPPVEIAHRVRVTVSWNWRERTHQTCRETILCRLLRS